MRFSGARSCEKHSASRIFWRASRRRVCHRGIEDQEQTVRTGRTLRNTLDDYNRYSGKAYRIQLSIGASRLEPGSELTMEQLMPESRCDAYEQKNRKAQSGLM